MKKTNWREVVEIVGVVSIVGSLLLLATEVRQSNRIANSEMEMNLAKNYNIIQHERATNPDFAKLYAKISNPDAHLITATEREQIRGLAWHYVNVFWAAQSAYENGVLSHEQLEAYINDFRSILKRHPALVEHFVFIRGEMPAMREKAVYQPINNLVDKASADNQ